MRAKPHKGSWGDSYIIEPRQNKKRITCNFCGNYNQDGSCNVKPIVISEVGYDYWKYCKSFYLSQEYNTPENQEYVERNKKVKSIYVKEPIIPIDNRLCASQVKQDTNLFKTIKLGSKVWVYDKAYDEEVLYEIVRPEDADAISGKISIDSPVGQGLLNAKEWDICTIETPSGMIEYEVLKVK